MAQVTIWFGVALIALGLIGYVGTGAESPTALIPAAFGLVLLVLGMLARNPAHRKTVMHIAVVVGLLAFLGTVRGLIQMPAVLAGEPVERGNAILAQAVMAGLSLAFVVLCVRSFVAARRSR